MTVPTPELISSTWSPRDPQVSPDGTRVVWTAAPWGREGQHPERSLWVARVGEPASARRWTRGVDDAGPRWSPDATRIAFLSDREERGTVGLRVIDGDGGESRPLLTRKRAVVGFAWSPPGDRLAVLVPDDPDEDDERRTEERDDADVHGERWDSARVWLVANDDPDRADGPQEVAAPAGHVREVAWSPDGRRLALLVDAGPLAEHMMTTTVWVVTLPITGDDGNGEPDSGEPVEVCPAPLGRALGWSGDDTLLFLGFHDQAPQGSATVWAVPAGGGEPRVVGTGVDEPRCTTALVHPAGGGRALIAVAEGLADRLEWLDPVTGLREVALEVDGELGAVSVARPPGGPVVALVREDGAAGDLVGRVEAGQPENLVALSEHGPRGVVLARVEALHATAEDGTALDAVVLRPVGGGEGPWPTAVLVHGGPYGRSGLSSHAHPLDWGQLLAARGFAVVMPNYRGGVGHGHAFAAAARGDMGGTEWSDLERLVDAAVDAGVADPGRLGIGGWSQGGFLTAWAVTATDRFRVGVMGAGVSDWGMLAATSDVPDFEAALAGSRPWDGPGPHHAALGSPISYAARRTTPLLILHGAEDARVPVSQAVAFHRALAGQAAAVELVSYPREPHVIGERRHQVDVQERVLRWFERHLR